MTSSNTPKTNIDTGRSYLDEPESLQAWLIRLVKGLFVGVGFILPGLSGGVLAVIFRIYDPIIRFLAKPQYRFLKQVRYFIPVGIGAMTGIVLFSVVVDAAFNSYAAQFICLFIGFVIGTFPSLYRQAGKQGRAWSDWVTMAVSAVAIFAIMLAGGQALINVPPSVPVWFGSGALIGLGVIVPGMSPSNFLIYFGLYDKMAAGIKDFDPLVIIPLIIGLAVCVIGLARGAEWAFNRFYSKMYHFILGMVVGSSVAIFPTVVFPSFTPDGLAESGLTMVIAVGFAAAMLLVGTVASWLFSRLEDRVSAQRAALEAIAS